MSKKKVGILTAGGDCPGLNAAIRGFAQQFWVARFPVSHEQMPSAEHLPVTVPTLQVTEPPQGGTFVFQPLGILRPPELFHHWTQLKEDKHGCTRTHCRHRLRS